MFRFQCFQMKRTVESEFFIYLAPVLSQIIRMNLKTYSGLLVAVTLKFRILPIAMSVISPYNTVSGDRSLGTFNENRRKAILISNISRNVFLADNCNSKPSEQSIFH